ncbi:VP1 [Trichosanthes kirilowii gokushovirus]|nr:VP1 [Trichosanthes kirilowii gokushovirus]
MRDKPFQQPSVMNAQQHFARVPAVDIERSTFDRSHGYKTTFDAGNCIPFYVDEVLPGDTHELKTTGFFRLATPLKPIMDNIYVDIHYFFVPNRILWNSWQQFMGERLNPDDDPSEWTIPQLEYQIPNVPNANPSSVGAYMGLPLTNVTEPSHVMSVNALPMRAFVSIWNQWYRDENLQDSIPQFFGPPGSGTEDNYANSVTNYPRGKRHDYFTSCLPWPQKGDPVQIPIGDEAIVRGYFDDTIPWTPFATNNSGTPQPVQLTGESPATSDGVPNYSAGGFPWDDSTAQPLFLDPTKQVAVADLSSATSISINDLRTAFQIQKLLERDARGGTRYIELLLSHFGVQSSDARLQRPEFLGGGTMRVNINPVASTVPVQGASPVPQGNLAAVGTGVNTAGFSKSFEEHGYIIGVMSARADLTYQRTVERHWSRSTRYDYYWPSFAHLGEQAVLNKEIWYTGDPAIDNAVFGYQERYAEYRYKPSLVTGLFNSDADDSLDVWHLAQDFASLPALNGTFIRENPPIDRVIAVQSEPHFLADIWHDLKSTRPMPVYSVPGLIDHF